MVDRGTALERQRVSWRAVCGPTLGPCWRHRGNKQFSVVAGQCKHSRDERVESPAGGRYVSNHGSANPGGTFPGHSGGARTAEHPRDGASGAGADTVSGGASIRSTALRPGRNSALPAAFRDAAAAMRDNLAGALWHVGIFNVACSIVAVGLFAVFAQWRFQELRVALAPPGDIAAWRAGGVAGARWPYCVRIRRNAAAPLEHAQWARPATKFTTTARTTAPSRYDSRPWRKAVARIARVLRSVSDT